VFSAIPAVTTFSVNSPAAQSSAMEQVSQGLRTNNSEQLESRSVSAVASDADSQKVNRKNEDESRQQRQTEEKTTFQRNNKQDQQSQSSVTPQQAAQATTSRSQVSLDIMA
jgi:hypothetical protein